MINSRCFARCIEMTTTISVYFWFFENYKIILCGSSVDVQKHYNDIIMILSKLTEI